MFVQTTAVLLFATCLSLAKPRGFTHCPTIGHYLLPDESDCTKFYYCEYGYRRHDVRSCAPGTVFAIEHQVCVHPTQSNCYQQDQTPQDDYVNQYFDDKQESYPVFENSYVHTISGENIEDTDDIEVNNINIEETENNIEEVDSNFEDTYDIEETNVNFEETDSNFEDTADYNNEKNHDNDTEEKTILLDNGCPSDFNIYYTLPHEEDCNKYYLCNFGNKIIRQCGPGNWYDSKLQICVHPSESNCKQQNQIPQEDHSYQYFDEKQETSPFQLDERFTSDLNTVIPIKLYRNGCPVSRNVYKLLPHEAMCDMFYQCADGRKIIRTCGPGSYFNSNKQVCDLASNVDCVISDIILNQSQQEVHKNTDNTESELDTNQSEEDIIIDFENSDVHNKPGENIEGTSNKIEETYNNIEETGSNIEKTDNNNEEKHENDSEQEIVKLDNGCPSDFSISYSLPHEENCNKYYLCNFGKKIRRQCGPGNWYDDKLQICTWPHLANCANAETAKNVRSLRKGWNQWRTW